MFGRWMTKTKISLLVMSIYRMEMKRVYLLADLIVQNTISDSFLPDGNPDLIAIWSSLHYDPQDALDRALDARGYKRVLLTPQSTKRVTLIPRRGRAGRGWSYLKQRISRSLTVSTVSIVSTVKAPAPGWA